MSPNFSKQLAEGEKSCNFPLPYSLAMDVIEWSTSGSSRFISDGPCTDVCVSLDVTSVVMINYSKIAQN